jgi:hypothetical protein
MDQKVENFPDLVKVDNSYVVNVNDEQYRAALLRRKTGKRLGNLEERVCAVEDKLDAILTLLQNTQG